MWLILRRKLLHRKFNKHIEAGAQKYISQIEKLGGVVRCIETGYIQKEIQNSSYEFQREWRVKKRLLLA